MWHDKIIQNLNGDQIINDSKTPSGKVHVGSLRGVLIHDVIYRALLAKKMTVKYTFGIDDFDPLDGLPDSAPDWLKKYMGHPLCRVPAPEGSRHSDMANHYIADFLDIFKELGVDAEIYRMRDIYQSGKFNEAIDTILKNSDKVRKIYKEISNSDRPDNWHPFQVICENCGSLGSTEVSDYDGKKVTYQCKENLVSWVKGCGHKGSVSPFNGNGKLPWKLEWVAKWHTLGITIEGAGKDHCTKGGSRDVAVACLKAIFGENPPLNVPYEFFLVSGAKMSSSKGIGTSARDMASLLPPEVLRFLMTRTAPRKTVNFSSDLDYMVKLYNEYDRLNETKFNGKSTDDHRTILQMIAVAGQKGAYHPVGFQVLSALLQIPHLDVKKEITNRSKGDLDALTQRLNSAKFWLEHFIDDRDRVVFQTSIPNSVMNLSEPQRAFLVVLAGLIPDEKLTEDEYQRLIFDAARLTPLPQKLSFQAMYRALLDKDQGAKGGSLLSYLDHNKIKKNFKDIQFDKHIFWQESAIDKEEASEWLLKNQADIIRTERRLKTNEMGCFIELTVALSDGKQHLLRILTANETQATEFLNNQL